MRLVEVQEVRWVTECKGESVVECEGGMECEEEWEMDWSNG